MVLTVIVKLGLLRKNWRGQNVNVDKKKELNWDNKKGIEIIGNKKFWQERLESLETGVTGEGRAWS